MQYTVYPIALLSNERLSIISGPHLVDLIQSKIKVTVCNSPIKAHR